MIFNVKGNTLTAHGSIWNGDGMRFIQHLEDLEAKGGEVVIKLHTSGGSVFDGNLIYNALRDSTADIRIEIIGIAASMGAIISLSCDNVYMVENGFMMLHAPSGFSTGNALEHEHTAKLLRSIEKNVTKKLKSKTGQSKGIVEKWLNGDNWMDAETALSEGLISGVIDPQADIEDIDIENMSREDIMSKFSAVLMKDNPQGSNRGNHVPKAPAVADINQKSKQHMEILAKHLGLEESATEQTVLSAIQDTEAKLVAAADNLEKLQAKYNGLADAETKRQKDILAAELATAIKDGRLDKTAEASVKELNFESAMQLLKALPKRESIKGSLEGESPTAQYDDQSWDELDRSGVLAELKKNHRDYFDERYEQEFGK